MAEDAEAGRAIQGRDNVPTLTPLTYLRKSINSTARDARRDGAFANPTEWAGSAVTLAVGLLLFVALAFLP